MCRSNDGRTTTDRKYRPARRETSRYGKLEKVLRDLKKEKCQHITPQTIAYRIKILTTQQVISILRFTNGIGKGEKAGTYVFTGGRIRVDNAKGLTC